MKDFKIRFTPEAAGLFSRLHPENKKHIRSALDELIQSPYSGQDLQEELYGFKSYRSKRYRILYKVNEEENFVEIYYIGHRKDVYEQFRRLLNRLT
ncbi:type II toxin-antitoxin system RelE/ParE family toxin [Thermodesulfobacteriota bacterium]